MPVLDNAKHERFAQGIAAGMTADEAYAAAGYRPDRGNATRLTANDSIKARVAEILSVSADRAGVSAERVIAELAKIAFSDIRQVVSWRPEVTLVEAEEEGQPPAKVIQSRVTVLDSATLSDDAAAAVAEVGQSAKGAMRVKMHDKPAALEKLGRYLGLFKDRVEHTGAVNIVISPADAEL